MSCNNIRPVLDSQPAEMDTHLLQVFSDHHPVKMQLVSKVSETVLWLHHEDLGRQMTLTYILFICKVFFGSFYLLRSLYKFHVISFCLIY